MERKYTKGPWKYAGQVYDDYGRKSYSVVDEFGIEIVGELGGPIYEHDAQLIAAAPCLLEALEECVGNLVRNDESFEFLKRARAAIARATGDTR